MAIIYSITLEYVEGYPPYIRVIDGSGEDKFLHPVYGDRLTVEFGGEPGKPAVFADVRFRSEEIEVIREASEPVEIEPCV